VNPAGVGILPDGAAAETRARSCEWHGKPALAGSFLRDNPSRPARARTLIMANLAPSIGGHVCAWLETFLVHGPGDVQGSPIILDDEFRTFVWRAYELRSGGQRQYRRAFLSRPKGRGKSELAAMLAATELCGPVRFDRFADAGETCPLTGYVFAADGWMLETSTAYRPGEQSVAEASLDVWRMIESGELADPTLLVDHRQGADDIDIYDVAELRAALVEAYGEAAAWTNLEGIISEIFDPATDEADNRRYWLNQVVRATDQWMDPAAWDKAEAPQMIGAGEAIALGFDGSIRDDATALIGCRISDGHLFVIDVWERKDTRDLRTVAKYDAPMWEVDRRAVDAAVAHTMRHYRVVRLYADNWQWQDALDRWAAEWPGVVVSWPTNRERAMVHALERLHTAVNTGECTHAGDPVLTRHVLNARRRPVRAGDVIAKERDGSPKKIDAAVAATLAYEARADAVAAGATRPKRSRVPVSF
jgi:phage terminase large subunit-like protein